MLRRALASHRLITSPLVFGGAVGDTALLNGEFRDLLIDPWLSDEDRVDQKMAMLKQFSMDAVDGLADIHPQIAAPTLFIWGEDDPFFPVEDARAMTSQFGGPTTFEVVPGAKLLVHEEFPERFAASMSRFLRPLSPG